ncbi:MAG TPA: alpha/beta fold hydrolase [Rhizomicrobium sp.]|nr:alpha/beta fold hydrolase [Rhizomicrobium sp.]
MELKTVATHNVPVRYHHGGSGAPLVFLHGAGGLEATDPFLAALAGKYRVYAPLLPGYGDSDECGALRDMLDITLHTLDVVDALGLKDPILAGHSMGGMIAAEMAALDNHRFSRLALIAPAGLWLEDHPIPDLFSTMPYEYPPLLFHNAEAGAALMTQGVDFDNLEWLKGFLVTNARQLGMAGKILFPIPERGLAQRLYRIRAKTLLVWGDDDRLIAPVYAQAWKKAIAGAELAVIPDAGHMAIWEQTAAVMAALERLK